MELLYGEDTIFAMNDYMPNVNAWKKYYHKFVPLSKLVNNELIFKALGTTERRIAYMENESFFLFLHETYGREKVNEICAKKNYKKVFGKNLDELEVEWESYIQTKPAVEMQMLKYGADLSLINYIYVYGGREFCDGIFSSYNESLFKGKLKSKANIQHFLDEVFLANNLVIISADTPYEQLSQAIRDQVNKTDYEGLTDTQYLNIKIQNSQVVLLKTK